MSISLARKRRGRSAASDSLVFSLFRRNPKQAIVWKDTDKNTVTTDMIRSNNDKGGNVLKLGLFTGEDISKNEFEIGHKITQFHCGNKAAAIEENVWPPPIIVVFGKDLSLSLCFKKDFTQQTSDDSIPKNTDLTSMVDIVIHDPGYHYQIGEHIGLSASNFIKKKGVLVEEDNDTYGVPPFQHPSSAKIPSEKLVYLKVLQTDKKAKILGDRASNNLILHYVDSRLTKVVSEVYEILDDLFISFPSKMVISIQLFDVNFFPDPGILGGAASGGLNFINLNDKYYTDVLANKMVYLNDMPVLFNTNVLVHEVLHIMGFSEQFDSFREGSISENPPDIKYIGSNGIAGYKQLLNANLTSILATTAGSPPLGTTITTEGVQDFNHIAVVPLEDDGGPGTHIYHWEDISSNSDPRVFDGKRHPILKNEIMTGYVSSGPNPDYEYLTTMTTGLFKDLNYTINDNSKWVTTTGTNMSWE